MRRALFCSLLLTAGCLGGVETMSEPASNRPLLPPPAERAAAVARAPLEVTITAPSSARLDPTTLGASAEPVHVRVRNVGAVAAQLRSVQITLNIARDGVAFRCHPQERSTPERVPRSIAPGDEIVIEHPLDCETPLPGVYDLQVAVHAHARDGAADRVGRFRVTLDSGARAPNAYPGREGLYVSLNGAPAIAPLSREAWTRGDYQVVLAVINGGPRPIRVGSATLRFHIAGAPSQPSADCADARVALPAEVAPGAIHVARAPLACVPLPEGEYRVVARIALSDGGESAYAGTIALRVSRDPLRFTPLPAPFFDVDRGQRP